MKTFGTIPGWLTRVLRVLAAFALAGVAGWFSPWITASIWHAFHPRGRVMYRGLEIRVPWPWTADTDLVGSEESVTPEGLALKKMPPTMDLRQPPQSVFVTVISPDPGVSAEEQTKRWMEVFRASHAGAKFEAATPVGIPAGASCLSADNPARAADIIWTCISVSDGWVANFEGHTRDEPVFFQVVGNLKR
jgi:hypothetical protein